jgi:DNA repair ATPase RecN
MLRSKSNTPKSKATKLYDTAPEPLIEVADAVPKVTTPAELAQRHFRQGQDRYRRNDLIGARTLLTKAVQEDPSLRAAKQKLLYVTEEIEDIVDELADLHPKLAASPDDTALSLRVGKLSYLMGKIGEGTALMKKAAESEDAAIAGQASDQLRKFGVK